MDNPTITTPRSEVPEWARADDSNAPDPDAWTAPQKQFVLDLIERKDTSRVSEDAKVWLANIVAGKQQLTKRRASELIDKLLKYPDKPKPASAKGPENATMEQRFNVGVPAGRYAIENADGELRFYNVWVSRDKKRMAVYVLHGPDQSDLKYQQKVLAILNAIKTAGIRECAIRYGLEIGECSNCGRRLTNRISRELGIGPICGGRMFGEDGSWKVMVRTKRDEISARGEDPDEELE